MANVVAVVAAAERLSKNDEDSLALLIGMREKEIEKNPKLKDDPDFMPKYDTHMGLIDDVKALGWRIVKRWNKELHGVVCGANSSDEASRSAILKALNLGEVAVIGAVATALIAMAVPAALAAAVAPLIVKKFILPAKEELCIAWDEAIKAQG